MDGETRKIARQQDQTSCEEFLRRFQTVLVMVSGPAEGSEFSLDKHEIILGRGPGVDLTFDDTAMSRAHAAFELTQGGFRVRDMASTNGIYLNGTRIQAAELKHGDRIDMGEHCFQYVVEEREATTNTYLLPD